MTRWTPLAGLVACATLLATVAPAATAALPGAAGYDPRTRSRSLARQAVQAQQDIDQSTARLAAATLAFQAAEAQLPAAQANLVRAQDQVQRAQVLETGVRSQLARTVQAEQAATAALRLTLVEQARVKERAGQIVAANYRRGPVSDLEFLFNAFFPAHFNPAGLAARLIHVQKVVDEHGRTLRQLRAQRAEYGFRQNALLQQRAAVQQQQQAAQRQVVRVVQLTAAANAASAKVRQLVAQRQAARVAAETERAEDLAHYAQIRAEQAQLAAEVRALMLLERDGGSPRGVFLRPVGGRITSPYGMRYHPVLRHRKLHTGTDFSCPQGTGVRVASSGRVIRAGWSRGYGYRIVVSHGYLGGRHLVTTYNHLSKMLVKRGQRVSRGQVIAKSGNTGWSTGPHLHFEVMVNGGYVNPMGWL